MREHLYRAWNKETKYMVKILNDFYLTFKRDGWKIDMYSQGGEWCEEPANSENGDILLQYIGLKDKNGKKIFEGDILDGGYEIKFGEHKFENWMNGDSSNSRTHLGFYAYEKPYTIEIDGQKMNYGNNYMPSDKLIKLQIIGNIHENPELLKTK